MLSQSGESAKPRIKGYREDRSGLGFHSGHLVGKETPTKANLVIDFVHKGMDEPRAIKVADALVRMRNDSFALRPDLLGSLNVEPNSQEFAIDRLTLQETLITPAWI